MNAEVSALKSNQDSKNHVTSTSRRRLAPVREDTELVRFFLAKEAAAGTMPHLGKEFESENEALIESMRAGLSYYTVSEWKATPDFSTKNPQILKQAVVLKQPHS